MYFARIIHHSNRNVSRTCKEQRSWGDFLYFTKLTTHYEHSTKRAKNLIMALECGLCRELICKSAALGSAELLQDRSIQSLHFQSCK